MIILNNINLPIYTDFNNLKPVVSKLLNISESKIKSIKLNKKSLDSRQKNNLHFCCSILVDGNESEILSKGKKYSARKYEETQLTWKKADKVFKNRPIVIGFGPAGMFAGLTLAKAGLNPIIIEQGPDADTRIKDVNSFFKNGTVLPNSNVQFGEGGAGTFSDGKLNTGIKNKNIKKVLQTFYLNGAKQNILFDAKPHIGTDILVDVVKNIRKEIIKCGGKVLFLHKLTAINLENNKLKSITVNNKEIPCDNLILAVGHSSRDTFEMLYSKGVKIEAKPFAVGCRIEHLQKDINKTQYGKLYNSKYLQPADYKLAVHLSNGRGVYTFCMCPGGYVVNASSELGGVVVNGMSYSKRNGKNANSAVLVNVNPEDFEGNSPLKCMYFQREIEQKVFNLTNSYSPVSVTLEDFLNNKPTKEFSTVLPTVQPKTASVSAENIYPSFITGSLKQGIVELGKKLHGFDNKNAVLTFPETRSSSPVRILRDNTYTCNIRGIYPCGEGAGYAGGITSAAVDGIKVAESIIDNWIDTDIS